MKKLTELILMNWHSYELQTIRFDDLNFLTGKNATGKSTIIDALQLVILGDTSGSFFNKAASSRSTRTLASYLFGEMGDDSEAGFKYRRNGTFSSYVATVWLDTTTGRSFTAGFMADCYRDRNFDRHWFMASGSLKETDFIDSHDVPYTFALLKGRLGKDAEFFDVNQRYQEALCAKLGSINRKYMSLLRKAVPFTPITDIEKFITESICDIDTTIHIENMQSDIRTYTDLENESMNARMRLELLDRIIARYGAYRECEERVTLHEYILARADKDLKNERLEKIRIELGGKNQELAMLEERLTSASMHKQQLKDSYDAKMKELLSNSELSRAEMIKERIQRSSNRHDELIRRLEATIARLANAGRFLHDSLMKLSLEDEEIHSLASMMMSLSMERISAFDIAGAAKLIDSFKEGIDRKRIEEENRYAAISEDIAREEERKKQLEDGIKPYPTSVSSFQQELKEAGIRSTVLAEHLEVKDDEWRDTLEAVLGDHRFDILVSKADFPTAKEFLVESGNGGRVSIIAVDEERNAPKPGSIADHLISNDTDAEAYVHELVGRIGEDEKPFLADTEAHVWNFRQMTRFDEQLFMTPFLGRNSIELQLKQCKEKLQALYDERSAISMEMKRLSSLTIRTISDGDVERMEEDAAAIPEIEELETSIKELEVELAGIDMLYVDKLRKELDEIVSKQKECETERDSLQSRKGAICNEISRLQDIDIPTMKSELKRIEEDIVQGFEHEWVEETAENRYLKVLEDTGAPALIRENYTNSLKGNRTKAENAFAETASLRNEYNTKYHAPYDPGSRDNSEYQDERDRIANVRLPEYEEKIKAAKEGAFRQFREDFISKIKSRIQDLKSQIGMLNSSLRGFTFGRDRYRFEVSANPDYKQYYDMFMDPLLLDVQGGNLYSEAFFDKYRMEVEDLFSCLIVNDKEKASAERMAQYERDLARYTDYRTYLIFDLIVIDTESGAEQRLSKTLLKKSGGETQLPFYIALLASFSQVCRIRQHQDNTVRLVIFDEAFSKMDAERIRESIKLLRQFGLQAIFSAPSDKIKDIAPFVDEVIVAYRDSRHSFTRCYTPGELTEKDA